MDAFLFDPVKLVTWPGIGELEASQPALESRRGIGDIWQERTEFSSPLRDD